MKNNGNIGNTLSRRSALRLAGFATIGTVAASTLAGCASDLPPVTTTDTGAYRLDSGDRVRVIVYGQQDMSGEYNVSDSGNLAIPLVGNLSARGRTTSDVESQLKGKLRDGGYLRDPSVAVEVLSFRPFYVLGEVAHPGQFAYIPGMTVLTAAAVAGGFTYRARTDRVSITRLVDGRGVEGSAQRTDIVAPGDVILVHERFF